MGYAAAAGLVLTAIGTAVGVAGQQQAAASQSKAAAYSAEVAKNNALIANQNAQYAIQAGQAKAVDEGMKVRNRQAAVRAGIAASGIDTNTGSAADVQTGQREIGTLEQERTAENAALTAYGYRTQQTNFAAQSGLDKAASSDAATAGNIGATGSLLAGAGGLGVKWAQLRNVGAVSADNPLGTP